MGVTSGVRCVDCDVYAPELGDFGSLGLPSASTEERSGEMQSFGYLFIGFRAIGMVTAELADFLAFLRRHEGHRLTMVTEDEEDEFEGDGESFDDEEDDWGDEDLWEEDEAEDAEEEERSVELAAKMEALFEELKTPLPELAKGDYVVAHYALECKDCEESFRTEYPEALQPMPELEVTDARAALFLGIVYQNEESFYRSQPFSPDDLDEVAVFLDEHLGHNVTARLIPEAGAD